MVQILNKEKKEFTQLEEELNTDSSEFVKKKKCRNGNENGKFIKNVIF